MSFKARSAPRTGAADLLTTPCGLTPALLHFGAAHFMIRFGMRRLLAYAVDISILWLILWPLHGAMNHSPNGLSKISLKT